MTFKCPKCGMVISYDGRLKHNRKMLTQKTHLSYCRKSERYIRMRKV